WMMSTLCAPGRAAAYEDQLTVGVEAGTGIVVVPETTLPCCGALLGVSSSLGLNDVWSLRAHLDWAWHPSGGPDLQVGLFGIEALYLVDIVQIVPYFGLGLDALATIHEGAVGIELGAHGVVGADYLVS